MGNFAPEVGFHGRSESPPPPRTRTPQLAYNRSHIKPEHDNLGSCASGTVQRSAGTLEQPNTNSVFTADGTAFPLMWHKIFRHKY